MRGSGFVLLMKVEPPQEPHPSLFTILLCKCLRERWACSQGTECNWPGEKPRVTNRLLSSTLSSEHHVTLNGGELSRTLYHLNAQRWITRPPPSVPPRPFSYITFVCLHSSSWHISVICRLVGVLAAGTVLSLFTVSLHKQGQERRGRTYWYFGTSSLLIGSSCSKRH